MPIDSSGRARGAAAAGLGGFALVLQTVLLREFLVLAGGDELTLGFFLAAWLLVAGGGSLAGGRLSARALPLALPAAAALPALSLFLFRRAAPALAGPGEALSFLQSAPAALLCLAPAVFAQGLVFTLLLAGRGNRPAGARLGGIAAAEAAGALAAGLGCAFAGAWRLAPLALALGAGAACCLLALPAVAAGRRLLPGAAGLLLGVIAAAGPAAALDARWAAAWWAARFPAGLERRETIAGPAGRLDAARLAEDTHLFLNGHEELVFSPASDAASPALLAHLLLAFSPAPRRACVAQGGLDGFLQEALAYSGLAIDHCLADEVLGETARRFLPEELALPGPGGRLAWRRGDPRRFLAGQRGVYDLVALLAGAPRTLAANRFYTRECFAAVRRALAPGGILALTYPGGEHVLEAGRAAGAAAVLAALRAEFPATRVLPGDPLVLLAAAGPAALACGLEELSRRLAARGAATPRFRPEWFAPLFAERFDERQAAALLRQLPADAAANTDDRPLACRGLIFGGEGGLQAAGRWLDLAAGRWLFLLAGLAALVLLWPLAGRRDGRSRRAQAAAVFTSGLAGMILAVAASLLFQNAFGSLYRHLALLAAAYLGGLGLGAAGGAALGGKPLGLLLACRLAWACGLPLLPLLARGASAPALPGWAGEALFCAGVFLLAVPPGLEFPWLGARRAAPAAGAARAGAALRLADHAGGALGGLAAGLILVPALGLSGALAAAAFLHLAGSAGLVRYSG